MLYIAIKTHTPSVDKNTTNPSLLRDIPGKTQLQETVIASPN